MSVLPVTIVTGFLGAGKTTLVRRLLKAPHGLSIGLVLNEFGQAGIDAVDAAEKAFVELPEGCACCLRNPDLVAAMEALSARGDLDRVLVEPSGLADPLPLSWTLQKPELAGKVRLDAVVVVVDPLHHREAGREEWEAQVRAADVIVVTKEALASQAQRRAVREAVRAVNPHARFVAPDDVGLAALVLDLAGPSRALGVEAAEVAHSDFRAVSIENADRYDLRCLEDLLEAMPEDVFRAKGVVRTQDGWSAFHVVGGRAEVEPDVAAPKHGQSRLAFFGRGLVRTRVESLLAPCVVRP
ncbi:MAG: hypothetical protein RL199_138 [Pseudomonadota bacterium]|jgi:G3E family GTPase